MAQQIVTTYRYSNKLDSLQHDIDRLALVTALATGDYRSAVQIKRRMAEGDVKPLTEADLPGSKFGSGQPAQPHSPRQAAVTTRRLFVCGGLG
jgi:hypothetical protein